MGMVGDDLGAAITTAVKAIPGISITNDDELTAYNKALGNAIVTYVNANLKYLIPVASINTAGSPSAQVGPPSPVALSPAP